MTADPLSLRALVLRLRSLGESDLLLDVFSDRLGRITCVAKGGRRSQKRFFGLLLTGHFLELGIAPTKKGGDLWRLESARLLERHLGLRLRWRRLMAAGPVLELLLRATAAMDPSPPALELALITLARMQAAPTRRELGSALLVHLTRLLGVMGYGLNLSSCVYCGRPAAGIKKPRLSLEGGLACPGCASRSLAAAPGLLGALAAAMSLEPRALARLSPPAASLPTGLSFAAEFWRRVAGHDLPSLGLALPALGPDPKRS